MPLACVLQHIRCEPPGLFSGPLRDRGYVVETVELDEGGRLPDWREVGLVLAMGGPMGAYDEAAHPRLAAEKRWIAAAGARVPEVGRGGAGGGRVPRLAAAFAAARDPMTRSASGLFRAWLDHANSTS